MRCKQGHRPGRGGWPINWPVDCLLRTGARPTAVADNPFIAGSIPVLGQIKAWLDAEKQRVLPHSPITGTIHYRLNQWEALCRYTQQGYLNIDNNAAERAMKPVAIGRKNWLFAGQMKPANPTRGSGA